MSKILPEIGNILHKHCSHVHTFLHLCLGVHRKIFLSLYQVSMDIIETLHRLRRSLSTKQQCKIMVTYHKQKTSTGLHHWSLNSANAKTLNSCVLSTPLCQRSSLQSSTESFSSRTPVTGQRTGRCVAGPRQTATDENWFPLIGSTTGELQGGSGSGFVDGSLRGVGLGLCGSSDRGQSLTAAHSPRSLQAAGREGARCRTDVELTGLLAERCVMSK